MQKKVSILIPLYNAEAFISETIHCLLEQNYSNIEIIVVDDGSTDNSYSIVESIQNDKIILAKNERKGACAARNYAFQLSSGDYIQYLDADDLMDKDKLSIQVKELETLQNSSFVFGCWARFTDNINNVKWENMSINKDYNVAINILIDAWNNDEMVPVHSWLTPRELIKKAGLWNEELQHNQDGEFFSRVIAHSSEIKFCEKAKVYYRSNLMDSISNRSSSEKNAISQLKSYQLYTQNLADFIDDIRIRKALATNFLNFIYRFYKLYPHLTLKAEEEFYNLDVGKMWAVGGKNFKKLASKIGFMNALKLKKILN